MPKTEHMRFDVPTKVVGHRAPRYRGEPKSAREIVERLDNPSWTLPEPSPDKCIIWSPPGDCMALSKALNALVLYPGMTAGEIREAINCFNHMKQGALIISTQYGVKGYRIGPAMVFFLDGCPEDEAWRAQARARSERIAG
jgi:hypothetical protein